MPLRTTLLTAVLTLLLAQPTLRAADAPATQADPQALIADALKAYKAGHVQDSIDALQKAIAILQQSQRQGLAAYFPKAPEGWEAGELKSNSFSAGGNQDNNFSYTTMERDYTHKSDGRRVTVTLANSPQLIESFNAMMDVYKNAQTLAAMNQNPDTQITLVDQDGWKGWSTLEKGRSAQTTALHGAYLLTIQVNQDDKPVLDTFWKAIDLKGLAAQSTHKPAAK